MKARRCWLALALIAVLGLLGQLPGAFRTALGQAVQWNNGNGFWDVDSNWSPSAPGAEDDVVIDVTPTPLVTIRSGHPAVHSLNSTGDLRVEATSLTIGAGGGQTTGSLTMLPQTWLCVEAGEFSTNGDTAMEGVELQALQGGKLHLPNLTSYTPGVDTFMASGAGSLLDLPNLGQIEGPGKSWTLSIYAEEGGEAIVGSLQIPQEAAASGELWFEAYDPGSVVDISAVASLTEPGLWWGGLSVAHGGKIIVSNELTALDGLGLVIEGAARVERADGADALPLLASITNGYVGVADASPDFSGLRNVDGAQLEAYDGGTLALPPEITTLVIGGQYNGMYLMAGKDSLLDLSAIQDIQADGEWSSFLQAFEGGQLRLPDVPEVPSDGFLDVWASDSGTVIDLSSMTRLYCDAWIVVENQARLVLGETVDLGGEYVDLEVRAGGTISAGTIVLGRNHRLTGNGTIDADLLGTGTVAPGASAGLLVVSGDYSQDSGGLLEIEIAGTLPEGEFDVLEVGGHASLDGLLDLRVDESAFEIEPDMQFRILRSSSLSGRFVDLPDGAVAWSEVGGDGDRLFISYSDSGVLLSATVIPEPASWTLLLLGLSGVGLFAARRRRARLH